MEKTKLEANFTANASVMGNDVDGWDVVLTRKEEGGLYPITVLKGLSSAECYTRLGIDVPRKEIPELEGRAAAREHLKEALSALSGRTIVSTTEMSDVLLDAMRALGEDTNETE